MIRLADIIAIHRANDTGGQEAAMMEMRHRFIAITDASAPGALARILAMSENPPPPPRGRKPSQ